MNSLTLRILVATVPLLALVACFSLSELLHRRHLVNNARRRATDADAKPKLV